SEMVAVRGPETRSRPPRIRGNVPDRIWNAALAVLGAAVLVVGLIIVASLSQEATPSIRALGLFKFIGASDWDPVRDLYGAWPFIYGTLVTSALGLLL